MTDFNLRLEARREGVCVDGRTELDVLVRVQAPDPPADRVGDRRHPLNLAFVIDRSGSMDGGPLEQAKRCVLSMVESMRPDDRAALVAYDDRVDLLQPSMPLGNGRRLRELVREIRCGGAASSRCSRTCARAPSLCSCASGPASRSGC